MSEKTLTPIKTDLFRFASIRTPLLINEDRKKLYFINHDDPENSHFLEGIFTKNIEEARETVRQKVSTFQPIAKPAFIRQAVPALYQFSLWLSRNRNTMTASEAKDFVTTLTPLSSEKKIVIWDNLFYQLLVRNNPSIRQICIQLIIANHFLETISNATTKALAEQIIQTPRLPLAPPIEERFTKFVRRLAHAQVVVPKAFTVRKSEEDSDDKFKELPDITIGDLDLKEDHITVITDLEIDSYKNIEQEIKLGMNAGVIPKKDLLELFESPNADLFLSENTKNYLSQIPKQGVNLQMAVDQINTKIKQTQRKATSAIRNTHQSKSKKLHQTGNNQKIKPGCFVVSFEPMHSQTFVYMTIYLGFDGAYFVNADYTLVLNENTVYQSDEVQVVNSNINNALVLKLFPNRDIVTANSTNFRLKGEFTLGNGALIEFDTKGSLNATVSHGCAIPVDLSEPEAPPSDSDQFADGILYGVNRLGIGVLRRVEQEICCYVPGEVSRIENILAREYKERHTRNLISTETIDEDTTELEVENQTDTVSTSRFDLQSEIANELSNDNTIGIGASLGVSGGVSFLGNVEVSTEGYFDTSSSTSSSSSDSEAQTYAQEVTNSALERVIQRTTQKRTSRILSEFEENVRHGFDNREGTEHVTGVYRWIDIIYKNRLINYGKRLMIEFLIPEPSKFYKKAINKKSRTNNNDLKNTLEEPKHPSEHGINSATDISEDNYLELGRLYGVTLADPIPSSINSITKIFGPADDPNGDAEPKAKAREYSYTMNFFEAGLGDYNKYSANSVRATFDFDYILKTGGLATENGTLFILDIENNEETYNKDNLIDSEGTTEKKSENKTDVKTFTLPDLKNSIGMDVEIKNVYDFSITLEVSFKLDEQETISWQNDVYDAIMRAYDNDLEAYQADVKLLEDSASEENDESSVSNSDINRNIEMRELQRIAIELLTKPFGINMGEDFYNIDKCKVYQVKQNARWEKYAAYVKFFEQAIDWSLMAYLFYPYYWADKCDWADLIQTKDENDPIFESFLQSGMARMTIPVRRGFENAIDYYMETGDIWNGGGLVVDTDDQLYLSIEDELKEIEGFVEEEWETRVPTALTIVQGKSVYLDDEGLPCCEHITDEGIDTQLKTSEAMLGIETVTEVVE